MEDIELLRAVLAVAVADRQLWRAETGVIKSLADRAGVGQQSLEAMVEAAKRDESFGENVVLRSRTEARSAVQLLVGVARIDGIIDDEERRVIRRIAEVLGIAGAEFEQLYLAGARKADDLRRSRRSGPGDGSG